MDLLIRLPCKIIPVKEIPEMSYLPWDPPCLTHIRCSTNTCRRKIGKGGRERVAGREGRRAVSFRRQKSSSNEGPLAGEGIAIGLIPQILWGHSNVLGSLGGTEQARPQGSPLLEYPMFLGAGPRMGWLGACLVDLRSPARAGDKGVKTFVSQPGAEVARHVARLQWD